jgi:3-methyladenine DNA glycosylase AlkD
MAEDGTTVSSYPGPAGTALVEAVRAALAGAGDPERAVQQQRYMRSSLPFRGLSSPELRALLRPVLADPTHRVSTAAEWEATVRHLWDGAAYREERYAALALARHRSAATWRTPDALPLYRHLVVTGAWWDLVDDVASHLVAPLLREHRTEVTPAIREWAVADDLWLRRCAILSQLGSRTATDTVLLEEVIGSNVEGSPYGSEFFVRKAIGWALRDHARSDPEWVRDLLVRHGDRLSGLSRREAAKHL